MRAFLAGLFRAFLWCAAAIVVMAGIGSIVLRFVFPPSKIQSLVESNIQTKLGRQADIGAARINWSGITLATLKISEIPNFHAGTFLNAQGVRLEWNLRRILSGFNFRTLFPGALEGKLAIQHANNPYYDAHDFSVAWSLSNVDPSWRHLNGWARLRQGPGLIQNVDRLAASEKSAKIVLMPLMVLQNLDRLGFVKMGLPDLSRWPLRGIEGNYLFKDGTMTIEKFHVDGAQMTMDASGTVQLATQALNLNVKLHAPQRSLMGQMDMKIQITGTLSNPKTNLDSLKKSAFKATISNILQNPNQAGQALDNLKKLFH